MLGWVPGGWMWGAWEGRRAKGLQASHRYHTAKPAVPCVCCSSATSSKLMSQDVLLSYIAKQASHACI